MTQRGQDSIAVVQHLVGWSILFPVPTRGGPTNGGKIKLPIAFGAVALVDQVALKREFEMRGMKLASFQNALLIDGFTAKQVVPEASVQPSGTSGLSEVSAVIGDTRQWGGDPAGLVLLIAMKDDAVTLQNG